MGGDGNVAAVGPGAIQQRVTSSQVQFKDGLIGAWAGTSPWKAVVIVGNTPPAIQVRKAGTRRLQ